MVGALNVHARLERKLQGRTARATHATVVAVGLAGLLGALAVLAWRSAYGAGAAPLAFSACVTVVELARLRRAGALNEPFQRVGLRLLGLSLLHAALVVTALWESARDAG